MAEQMSWQSLTPEQLQKIRHLPMVVAHIKAKAQETRSNTGSPDGFDIVVQNRPETVRPCAYVMPNSKGIHLELSQGVLLKAALGMSG